MRTGEIIRQLRRHAPIMTLGTLSGLIVMLILSFTHVEPPTMAAITAFLFLAVWAPYRISDVAFPLLHARKKPSR
jgi:hypothetical protein